MSIDKSRTVSRLAAVALVTTVLASCGTPTIVTGEDNSGYSPSGASAALSGKQTAFVVYGNPFSGGDTNALVPAVAQSMVNSAPMIDTQFVPLPNGSSRPEYSVVMAFNAVGDLSPSDLCDQNVKVQSDPSRRPIRLQAAFCGPGAMTTSTGWLSSAQGPQDPEFQNLIFGVTRTLFPDSSPGDSSS